MQKISQKYFNLLYARVTFPALLLSLESVFHGKGRACGVAIIALIFPMINC